MTAVKQAMAHEIRRRKLYDEETYKITSGVDGQIWVHGIEKDSFSGEGHQDQYYPLEERTKEELQQKVKNLARQAAVKAKRTREHLHKMLNKYTGLFMTKGRKIEGTVQTRHRIGLKEDHKIQH